MAKVMCGFLLGIDLCSKGTLTSHMNHTGMIRRVVFSPWLQNLLVAYDILLHIVTASIASAVFQRSQWQLQVQTTFKKHVY